MKRSASVIFLIIVFFNLSIPLSGSNNPYSFYPGDKNKKNNIDTTASKQILLKADSLYKAQNDSAAYYYNKALLILGKDNKTITIAEIYRKTGNIYFEKGNYDTALTFSQKALSIHQHVGGEKNTYVADCYNTIGVIFRYLGNYAQALESSQKSLAIRIDIFGEKNLDVAASYNGIGVIYDITGHYDKSLEFHEKSLKIKLELLGNQNHKVAISYFNMGAAYDSKGDYERALEFYNAALKIDLALFGEKNKNIISYYNNIGFTYNGKGEFDKALEYFQKAQRTLLLLLPSTHPTAMQIQGNIGNIYNSKGQYDKALGVYIQLLENQKQALGEKHFRVAGTYNQIGQAYDNKGDYDNALKHHEKALAIALEQLGKDAPNVASYYNDIGLNYMHMKDYNKALEYFQKSLDIKRKLYAQSGNLAVAKGYTNIGDVYGKKNDHKTQLDFYQKTLIDLCSDFTDSNIYKNPEISQAASASVLEVTFLCKANAFHQYYSQTHDIKDLKLSFDTYLLASILIDKLRAEYQTESSKLSLGEKSKIMFEGAITVANELYEITKDKQYQSYALEFSEKSKSMVMLELANESKAKQFSDIPDSLLARQYNIKIDLNFYESQLEKEKKKKEKQDIVRTKECEDNLFALKRNYEELMVSIEKNYPKYYDLKYQAKIASIEDIQKSLDDKTAVLEYFVGDNNLYIYTITRNNFSVYSDKKDSLLNENVKKYCGAIKKADTKNYLAANKELYRQLILPIEAKITTIEKLVIIPDDILFYMPFEALVKNPPAQNPVDFSKLNYLVKEHSISYHYSSTLYLKNEINKSPVITSFGDFIGFAPVFKDAVNNGFIASSINALDTTYQELALRSITLDGKKFNALPYSEEEVRSIAGNFNTIKRPSTHYIDGAATEESFKQKAAGYKYIHVATHGFVNEENPDLSGIIFSQPKDSTNAEDGILYAGELYNLDLKNTDLVVLSSCESGIGKFIKGEGLLAMPRGFLYAGVPNIMYSLWKVDDKQTSRLMQVFYKNVLQDNNYSKALRATKLEMIKNPSTAFPRNWSGFVLVGK